MSSFFINKIKEINFNYDNILKDFTIVKFWTDKYIQGGALILDEISSNMHVKSVVFEHGKIFYALFKKEKAFTHPDLKELIDKAEEGGRICFEILAQKKVNDLPKYILAQLLLNSISNPDHERLTYNNLTGKLYLFNEKLYKRNKKKDIIKVVGLEIKISKSLNFKLNVKTFSRWDLFPKRNYYDCKYTFVHSKQAMRRVLPSEKLEPSNMYILKQEKGKKSTIDFLNFEDYNKFNISKVGMLAHLLKTVKSELESYLSLNLTEIHFNQTCKYKPSEPIYPDNFKLNLIDGICDEESAQKMKTLESEIEKLEIIEGLKIKVRTYKKEVKNGFNIKLIHNKAYYEKYKKTDPYQSDLSIQHLTLEDFKLNKKSTPSIIEFTIYQLLVKNDIKIGKVSIVDWDKYGFKEAWTFGIKEQEQLHFTKIFPNGKMEFKTSELDLFNHTEFNEIFDENKDVELVIKDHLGNINFIKRTENFTLPLYEEIRQLLEKEGAFIQLSRPDALKYTSELFKNDPKKKKHIFSKIENLKEGDWNKKKLLDCFGGGKKGDTKNFVNLIRKETGEILKTYFREEPTKCKLFGSQLDIHTFTLNDRYCYVVGTKGKNIHPYMTRASIVREIQNTKDSKLIFEDLLPLMNVGFIKNQNLTVLPFPLKYLREWEKSIRKKD